MHDVFEGIRLRNERVGVEMSKDSGLRSGYDSRTEVAARSDICGGEGRGTCLEDCL